MKLALSTVRENTPFATPPRVLVVADEGFSGQALHLADALDEAGAEAEVRFGGEFGGEAGPHQAPFSHSNPDAVVIAGTRGYRIALHHPILEGVLSHLLGNRTR